MQQGVKLSQFDKKKFFCRDGQKSSSYDFFEASKKKRNRMSHTNYSLQPLCHRNGRYGRIHGLFKREADNKMWICCKLLPGRMAMA